MRFRPLRLGTACVVTAVLLLGSTVASAQKAKDRPAAKPTAPRPAEKTPAEESLPCLALKGGTVLTATGAPIPGGIVLIQGGKIKDVGRDLVIPDDARVVDVTGKYVFPGLIDAAGIIGLTAADAASSTAGTAVRDGLDPFDRNWNRVLSGGVTAAFVAPRVAGPTTGILGSVIRVRPGVAPERLVLKDVAAVRAAVGASRGASDTVSRWRSAQALEKTLEGAKAYVKSRDKYAKDLAKWKKDLADWRKKVGIPDPDAATTKGDGKKADGKKADGKKADGKKATPKKPAAKKTDKSKGKAKKASSSKSKKKPPKRPKRPRRPKFDPVRDALALVLDRKIPLRVEAHRHEDIERTLDVAEKFKVRLVLEGATEAARSAERLAKLEGAVVAGPLILADPRRLEYEHHDPTGLGRLSQAGVQIAIGSASSRPTAARFLRLSAAQAQASGLDRATALAAVTSTAAEVLGVADSIGSLAAGKNADVVVADHHPLDTRCRIEQVYLDGELVYRATRP